MPDDLFSLLGHGESLHVLQKANQKTQVLRVLPTHRLSYTIAANKNPVPTTCSAGISQPIIFPPPPKILIIHRLNFDMDASTSTDAGSEPLPAAGATPPANIPTTLSKDDTGVVLQSIKERMALKKKWRNFSTANQSPSTSDDEDWYLPPSVLDS